MPELTHVDLRSCRSLRKIPLDRSVGTDTRARAAVNIGLVVCLDARCLSGGQANERLDSVLTQVSQEPA